jgi:hypothetical protein
LAFHVNAAGLITPLLCGRGTQEVLLRRRLPLVLAAALMLVLMMFAAFGPVSERGIAPRHAEAAPVVQVNVNCTSNPETTAVKNNTNRTIKVYRVGSIYQPRSNEPFVKNRLLGPRKSVTFKSGYGAASNSPLTLTRQYIYNNDVGRQEGARVATSVGSFIDRC